MLASRGWASEGSPPATAKYVMIAAPHTSNWDFVYLVALGWLHGLDFSVMMKHSLFRGPLAWLLPKLGAIPIRRDRRANMVEQMADAYAERDELILIVPAEATRSPAEYWKSGFYQIARAADVPVVLGFLDFERRRGGFGPELRLTGDVKVDMDEIRKFYTDIKGKHPQNFGQIRLKEENEPL